MNREEAEKLVEAYGRAMFEWGASGRLEDKLRTDETREALIKALTGEDPNAQ